MSNVTVKPIQTINVKVNQGNQQTAHSTIQFVGSVITPEQIQTLLEQTNTAMNSITTVTAEAHVLQFMVMKSTST
jgi:hypothetical protein